MIRLQRSALIGAVLLTCLASVAIVCPTWAADVGLDFWNMPALEESVAEDLELADQFAAESEVVQRSITVRCALTDDLIEGRATLSTVLAQCLELNRRSSDRLHTLRLIFPADCDE